MTELDFEELDKAVSDLMKDTTPEPTAPQLSQSASAPSPAPGASISAVSTPTTPVARPSTPSVVVPPVRPGARFMDVKPAAPGVATPVQPSATAQPTIGNTPVTPAAPVVAEPETPPASKVGDYAANPSVGLQPSDSPVQAATDAPEPVSTPTPSAAFHMPDPIDVASATPVVAPDTPLSTVLEPAVPATQDSTAQQAGATTQSTDGEVATQQVSEQTAMESPFIPDAKVEKRPLGGFADEPASDTATPAPSPEASTPLPRELNSDLMNLETDGNDVKPTAKADATVAVQPPVVAGNKPAEAANNSMLAAAAHTGPVGKPVKKKHGWLIVVWVILLMIVGAGAGAAYYYFTTVR